MADICVERTPARGRLLARLERANKVARLCVGANIALRHTESIG
jgi:hypothetical protein